MPKIFAAIDGKLLNMRLSMVKLWRVFKNQSLKGKSLIIWKLLMWVPVMISALIFSFMVALFELDIQSGIRVFEEIAQ